MEKGMCLWDAREQVSLEIGSAQCGSGLEWGQGCWVCSSGLCTPSWGSHIGQEHSPAFCGSLAWEGGLTVVSPSVSVTSQRLYLCPLSIDSVLRGSRQWPA